MQLAPEHIGTSRSWSTLVGGADHTCAYRTDHTVWCWGFNGYGQVGDGSNADEHQPVKARIS